jgi:hypothetical protein
MRIPRAVLLTAALAVVPAAATTPAFAADVGSHPTVRSDHHPGPGPGRHRGPPMNEQQRTCMEQKGFGPGMHRPDQQQRPGGREMDKRHQAFHEAAQACGLEGRNRWHKGPAGPSGPGGPGKPA